MSKNWHKPQPEPPKAVIAPERDSGLWMKFDPGFVGGGEFAEAFIAGITSAGCGDGTIYKANERGMIRVSPAHVFDLTSRGWRLAD